MIKLLETMKNPKILVEYWYLNGEENRVEYT